MRLYFAFFRKFDIRKLKGIKKAPAIADRCFCVKIRANYSALRIPW